MKIKLEIIVLPISEYHSALKSLYFPVKNRLKYSKSALINKTRRPVLKKEKMNTAPLILLISFDIDEMPIHLILNMIKYLVMLVIKDIIIPK